MSEPLVYLNGRMLPASEAALPIYDAGVVMGATVAEMTRTFGHRLFRLEDHLERLWASLAWARIDLRLSRGQLAEASQAVAEHNTRLMAAEDDLCLVHFISAGEVAIYAGKPDTSTPAPTVCVHTFPLPYRRWATKYAAGQRLVTPAIRHLPNECYDPSVKCRSRLHYYVADKQARDADPEASPLLLDLNGNITETSSGNFLLVEHGALVAPPRDQVLGGVSQKTVIELAAELKIPSSERLLSPADVLGADEALTTSTPYCLLPVTRLNGQPIGDGRTGPIYRRLLAAWSQRVGVDIERQMNRSLVS